MTKKAKGAVFVFDHAGTPHLINAEEKRKKNDVGFIWHHFEWRDKGLKEAIASEEKIDPVILKALTYEVTRPRFTAHAGNFFINLRTYFPKGAKDVDLASFRVWVEKDRIVTVSKKPLFPASELDQTWQDAHKNFKRPAELVLFFIEAMTANLRTRLQDFSDLIDRIEQDFIDPLVHVRESDVASMRLELIKWRRYMMPQKMAIEHLMNANHTLLEKGDLRNLGEYANYYQKIVEDIDLMRERLQIITDEIQKKQADQLNKNLYKLTIVTVLFLPLTFISGLLGMNVTDIPFSEENFGFWVVLAIMLALLILQIIVMRRTGWFKDGE